MRLPLYQVDAFTSRPFAGNPAAVVPLETWLPDATMQAIAAENNLAETAFLVNEPGGWRIRWFTPTVEVDLCGHATLASGWVLFNVLAPGMERVELASRSGPLRVEKEDGRLVLDFPARPAEPVAELPGLVEALGARPRALLKARDLLAVFDTEDEVRALRPDLARLGALPLFSVVPTAPGRDCDFVSRFFGPAVGVPEDPVTGSAHCTLVPYWAERLGKQAFFARQVSPRGGELYCRLVGDRVRIGGDAVRVIEGTLHL